MQQIQSWLSEVFNLFRNTFGIVDLIDIAVVAMLIYAVLKFATSTHSWTLIRGIVLIGLIYFFAQLVGFKTLNTLLSSLVQIGITALIIVFQPELRRALEHLGQTGMQRISLLSGHVSTEAVSRWRDALVNICESAENLSRSRTGALIVIERITPLDDIIETGSQLNSGVNSDLLETIFYEGTPLHDGAVIIRDGRLAAAGCLLPVSKNQDLSRDMGTRHRAALGISEASDAVVVVVSEETGLISVARDGVMLRHLDRTNLLRILQNEIIPEPEDASERTGLLGRIFKKNE